MRIVTSSLPAGYVATYDKDGVITPNVATVTLTCNQNRTDVDFGYKGCQGTIGDKVWDDKDGDGVQDSGESGIPGVTVQLYNSSNVLVATATTNSSGKYSFTGLTSGTYTVKVVVLDGRLRRAPDLRRSTASRPQLGHRHPLLQPDPEHRRLRLPLLPGLDRRPTCGTTKTATASRSPTRRASTSVLVQPGRQLEQWWSPRWSTKDGLVRVRQRAVGRVDHPHRHHHPARAGYDTATYDLDGLGSLHQATVTLGCDSKIGNVDFGYRNPSNGSGWCPRTIGYWKTHVAEWPVTSLKLGNITYNQTQLLAILN